ncbi:putative Ras-related protein Rab7 [Ilyonectria robusta]
MQILTRDTPALGYCRSRTIPVSGRGILPRCRLLCSSIRCQQRQELRGAGQLARRVPDPGVAPGSAQLPLRKLPPPENGQLGSVLTALQVVLGNKIDVEESKRVVGALNILLVEPHANTRTDFEQACHDFLPVQG